MMLWSLMAMMTSSARRYESSVCGDKVVRYLPLAPRLRNSRPCSGRSGFMAFADRLEINAEIERIRQSKVVCYLTSLRPNLNAAMGEDAVRFF